MTGISIGIKINGSVVAMSTSGGIDISQEAVEYTPMPGTVSSDEAGWKHFRRGDYKCSITNDSFFTFDGARVLALIGGTVESIVAIGDVALESTSIISSASINADVNGLSKMSIKADVNGLPELKS